MSVTAVLTGAPSPASDGVPERSSAVSELEIDAGICKGGGVEMEFDFYYGLQSQTFSFYRIPKLLFTDPRFSSLSAEAKTLYGILLDRMDLSMKNGWLDKQKRVYLFFTVQEIQESLGCGKNKAIQLMLWIFPWKRLKRTGLISLSIKNCRE